MLYLYISGTPVTMWKITLNLFEADHMAFYDCKVYNNQ